MIIPALDLIDGKVVRLFQGDYGQQTGYEFNPLSQFIAYENAGAQYLHLVDLTGAKDPNKRQLEFIRTLVTKINIPLQVGGGIRTLEDIDQLLSCGVDRVVVGSKAILDPPTVAEWLLSFGAEKIVLALDVNIDPTGTAFVAYNGWQNRSLMTIEEVINFYIPYGLKHILCTDISKDGTLLGSNVEFYSDLYKKYPNLAIQASGGIGSLEDIQAVYATKISGLIIGKALLEHRFTLEEAILCWPNESSLV